MSAFIVAPKTMSRIIRSLYADWQFNDHYSILKRAGYAEEKDFDRLYQELYIMNRNAVVQRYNEPENSDYIKLPETINWDAGQCTRIQALKAMQCLRYQCSEGNVPETPLFKFLEDLIYCWSQFIISQMPEYETAEWG